MQLNPAASTILVSFYLVSSVLLIGLFAALLYVLLKLNSKFAALEAKLDPLLSKADNVLTVTNDRVTSIGEQTETILSHGVATAEGIHTRLDQTASSVQRTVNAPIIGLNSVAAGLTQCLRTFAVLQRDSNDTIAVKRKAGVPDSQRKPAKDSTGLVSVRPAELSAVNTNGAPLLAIVGEEK